MQVRSKAYVQMHGATFLWGITAILGKLIVISEFPLVWYRMLFVSLSLVFFPSVFSSIKTIPRKTKGILCGIGILLSIHWVAWYGSIKYSNASVAVSCIACISLFIAILEPLIFRDQFNRSNILLGIMVIPGIVLINRSLDLQYKFGFMLGMLAALIAAVFTMLNKRYTQEIPPESITFVQMVSGWIFLTLCLPFYISHTGSFGIPGWHDLFLLLVLSICCTAIPYNLFLRALKQSNAFTTSLINNLEPVYGIVLAILFLHENKELNWRFYLGTLIILSAVFIHAILNNRKPHVV
jgi:drug/metabolite transporter (DMT)-like permease